MIKRNQLVAASLGPKSVSDYEGSQKFPQGNFGAIGSGHGMILDAGDDFGTDDDANDDA